MLSKIESWFWSLFEGDLEAQKAEAQQETDRARKFFEAQYELEQKSKIRKEAYNLLSEALLSIPKIFIPSEIVYVRCIYALNFLNAKGIEVDSDKINLLEEYINKYESNIITNTESLS